MKLHQLLAILPSQKNKAKDDKTGVYKAIQKPALFAGLTRTYEPRDDDGFQYPGEINAVQFKAWDLIDKFQEACSEYFDLAATQDKTNCAAIADVVVDGGTLLANVPVSHLLFLEKQLTDIRTFVDALPVLPDDKAWKYNLNLGLYETEPKITTKTKKITRPVVFYEATKEHPAQVKEVTEDVPEGTWRTVEQSSALSPESLKILRSRIETLYHAVLMARESANAIEVTELKVSSAIFGYLFDSAIPSS